MKQPNQNFKRLALNLLNSITVEAKKLCSNRATRPTVMII